MFENFLKNMYLSNTISKEKLHTYVPKFITEEKYQEIVKIKNV